MSRKVIQRLSQREESILKLAADGLTDGAMAIKLGISEGTVGTYWSRIRAKIGPYSRTELVAVRVRNELQQKLDAVEKDRAALSVQLRSADKERGFYESILDSSEDGIIIVHPNGEIVHANPAAHAIFCSGPDQLAGRPLLDLIPDRYRETHLTRLAEFVRNPDNRKLHPHLVAAAIGCGGEEIKLSIVISAVNLDGQLLLVGFLHQVDAT